MRLSLHYLRIIDSLSSNNTALNNKVNTIESSLYQLKPSQRANTVTRDAASKIVDEYRDMERRQWNLIISNAPESESIPILHWENLKIRNFLTP